MSDAVRPWRAHIGLQLHATTFDRFEPTDSDGTPGVITLHGAGGRREDLTQFAVALAARGLRVWNVDWRDPGSPPRLADFDRHLAVALSDAAETCAAPVAVVAWSDAMFPLALAAVDPAPSFASRVRAVIGLGGYYGWRGRAPDQLIDDATASFFGGATDAAATWRSPLSLVGETAGAASRDVPIHVVVGDHDTMRAAGIEFHDALRAAGRPTTLCVIGRCDHYGLIVPRLDGGAATLDLVVTLIGARVATTPGQKS